MRYQLPNGLTVVIDRQNAAPVVALQVWVKAGSADETPEEAGLAHLHEHMLFKGTSRRGLGEIARAVESRGGEINAWTSFDQTVYHLVLASQHLADGLDILSDAVRHSAFDADELAREIEVVVEEIKRSQDLPSRRVSRRMFETAYQSHPYRAPVLGTEESVRSFTREKVLAFFNKHYRPDNMVVVVAGDVDEQQAREEIERHFGGSWGRSGGEPIQRAAEPPQQNARVAILREPVKEAHFALAWHIPGIESEEIAALDALAVLLGQGEGARLSLGLKIEQPLVSEAYAYAYTPRDPGLLVAGAALDPTRLPEAIRATLVEVRRLQTTPLEQAELEVSRALIEADAVYGRETVQGVARKLGFYEAVAGDLGFEARYYEAIARLKPEDLVAVARKYLVPGNLTFAGLFPPDGPSDAQVEALIAEVGGSQPAARAPSAGRPMAAAREALENTAAVVASASIEAAPPDIAARIAPDPAAPSPTGAIPAAVPATRPASRQRQDAGSGILTLRLASGAQVLVKPERGVPLVALRAVYPGGLRHETERNNGVSQLYARLMTRATQSRSAAQMARAIDDLAGGLQGSAGRSSIALRGEFLARHFDRALRLMAECINEPSFAEEEIERERPVLLQDIRSRDDNPSGAAFELFTRTLYTVHPYRFDTLGEESSVRALGRADLEAVKAVELHPSNLTFSIVGDIDPDHAFAAAEELFGNTGCEAPERPPVPAEPPQLAPRRAFRELDKAQSHLIYGFPGLTVDSPKRFALDVLSSVLSGQGGRLFLELRDKRSMAYSVSSFSVEGIDPGYFGIYMGTSPDKVAAALGGIRDELKKLTDGEVSEAEIERARRYLVGAHAIGLQKNSARAAMIAYDAAYGTGADAYLRYAERIESVTAAAVLDIAREILDPSRGTLAILGPRSSDVDF